MIEKEESLCWKEEEGGEEEEPRCWAGLLYQEQEQRVDLVLEAFFQSASGAKDN